MDDTCAVCADVLEWVAYGTCGHRDVCATCVVRLRFICDDRRCCICKSESSVIFVTKALGDYTRMINDFSLLPAEPREGRAGSYWYHEGTQAFFDDVDQYKMIKAMCRLSCCVCDKADEERGPLPSPGVDGPKRKPARFRNIEHLKGHLFHKHRLSMCSLCLEGRKVFICEQKLYTRSQLNQHIRTGNSEVDGSENERGGFAGHPMCELCKTPFYGDNELYSHMSTEHYKCHICQRQHPGRHEYYKNYDELEMHFRRDHFLCEDEGCLAKKFVVFQSDGEMKRHNTLEHGGRMSRSQRNAALQIPTSFRYQRGAELEQRRRRGRTFRRDESDNQQPTAIEASLGTGQSEASSRAQSSASDRGLASDHRDTGDIDPLIQPFESLTATGLEVTRYRQALGCSSVIRPLEQSSFPPLPVASGSSQQNSVNLRNEGMPDNTMAAQLRQKIYRNANAQEYSAQAWPEAIQEGVSISSRQVMGSNGSSTSQSSTSGTASSGYPSLPQARSQVQARHSTNNGHPSSALSSYEMINGRICHSASAPNLAVTGLSQRSISDFPPVTAAQVRKIPANNQVLPAVADVQSANKSLVEKLRSALKYDNEKYTSFKEFSAQYRQGQLSTTKYLDYVQQYGLQHLVLDLARLCPDPQKQQELVDTYSARVRSNGRQDNGSKKGKAPAVEAGSSRDRLADNVINTVRSLQSQFKPREEDVEELSRDGYRDAKGKSNLVANGQQAEPGGRTGSTSSGIGSTLDGKDAAGGGKTKKMSKFLRARLGDGSMATLLDGGSSSLEPDPNALEQKPGDAVPVRGVWRKGGVQKLFL